MTFYSFQELSKVLKKKYKITIVIFIFLLSICLYANKTFLSNKLDRKYSVSFDYQYHYGWVDLTTTSINYAKDTFGVSCEHLTQKVECLEFPYSKLEKLIVSFFQAVYRHNMDDVKPKGSSKGFGLDELKLAYEEYENYKGKYFDIALAFSYDNLNFEKYYNKKLHVGWSSVKEAEEYLQSLHDRASADLMKIIKLIADENNIRMKRYYGNKLLTFPASDIGQRVIEQYELKNELELDQFIKKTINKFKLNDINDADLFKLIFQDELFYPGAMEAFVFNTTLGSYEEFSNTVSTKRDIIYYYLGSKYNSVEKINTADLNFYPSSYRLINNFKNYIPKYKIKVVKVNRYYIYLIEIFLALLVTFVIILTLNLKDKENFKDKDN